MEPLRQRKRNRAGEFSPSPLVVNATVPQTADKSLLYWAVSLMVAAVAIFAYDCISIARGTVDAREHIPILLSVMFFALSCAVGFLAFWRGDKPDNKRPQWTPYTDEENLPKGQINAHDGMA